MAAWERSPRSLILTNWHQKLMFTIDVLDPCCFMLIRLQNTCTGNIPTWYHTAYFTQICIIITGINCQRKPTNQQRYSATSPFFTVLVGWKVFFPVSSCLKLIAVTNLCETWKLLCHPGRNKSPLMHLHYVTAALSIMKHRCKVQLRLMFYHHSLKCFTFQCCNYRNLYNSWVTQSL